jgi:hypothetical protein
LVLVILIDWRYGPGLSPDSAEYVASATSLLKGEGFRGLEGDPLVLWPPLFPAAIGVASAGVLTPTLAGGIVNGLAFAGTVVLSLRHLRRSLGDSVFAAGGSIAIVFGPPLLLVATFVWAEAVFVLLTLLCLLKLVDYLEQGRRRDLFLSALFAGLGAVTRYAGLTLIITGLAVIALDSGASRNRKLRSSAAFLGLSATPLGLFILRNIAVSSALMGTRADSQATWGLVVERFVRVVYRWFLPQWVSPVAGTMVFLLAIAIVAFALGSRRGGDSRRWPPAVFPMAIFVAVYSMTLVTVEALSLVDSPTDRMLAPIYVPAVFLLVMALDRFAGRIPTGQARLIISAVVVAGVCAVPLQRAVQRVSASVEFGAGWYASTIWQESDLIQELKNQDLASEARLFTNDSAGLYLVAGVTAELSAASYSLYSDGPPSFQLADLTAVAESEPSYLVWFDFVDWPFLVTLDVVDSELELVRIVSADDGSIYRVNGVRE